MKSTYKIITVGEGYWIEKTTPKKFLFWKWDKKEIIGAYKWGAEESGLDNSPMPFFFYPAAETRLKQLENES